MACLDKQLHTFRTVFQPYMSSSLAFAPSFNTPSCIMKRSPSLAINRLNPHSQFDQILCHFVIAQVASLGQRGPCQLALNLRVCAFGVEIVHNVEFPFESCKINGCSVLVFSMVYVNFCLLYEELDDLQIEAFDCVEDRGLFLQIQELKVASQFKQEPKSWDTCMNGSKVSQVKTFLDAFIDNLRIRQAYSLNSFQVIALNSRKKLRVREPFVLNCLDDSVEFGAEYQRIEFVLKVLFKLIMEVGVKLYEKRHQLL